MPAPDFTKPAPDFASGIRRLTDRIVSARVVANAIVEGQEAKKALRMSVTDKIDLLNQRHAEFERSVEDRAQKLLERYEEIGRKAEKAFDRRHSVLAVREKKFDEMDAAIDRLSNETPSA